MKLFLCEKPSQAAEIARHVGARKRDNGCFTGDGVTVTYCIGHLLEQAKPEAYEPLLARWDPDLLPVIPAQWQLEVKPAVKTQYSIVTRLLKQASELVIATDADREGEVIAREMMQAAGYRGSVSRLWLSAFDDASVRKALGKLLPGAKTAPMYAAGLGRSRADWLAGMNVTMMLTTGFGTGGKGGTLHFGRVQTPVLALVVRRERAIRTFVPKTYYELQASFELASVAVPMAWRPAPALLDPDGHVVQAAVAKAVADKVRGQPGRVDHVEAGLEREAPPLLFSLASLQREASARYGIKAQAVLDACQALYEKHKATTYPRTDCEYLPSSMLTEMGAVLQGIRAARSDLAGLVSSADLGSASRAFNDRKITAHHAIVPSLNPRVSVAAMSKTEQTIYDMIVRRYLAQCLGDFHFHKTVIEVICAGERFRVSGKTPQAPGWKRAYPEAQDGLNAKDASPAENVAALPAVQAGDAARNLNCDAVSKKTKPPRRYTEGTLIAAMESIDKEIEDERLRKIMRNKEKAGIGTDATRAAIIENLFKRDYLATAKRQVLPTPRAEALITLIEANASQLADPVLTAEWEDRLMQVEAGTLTLEVFERELAIWLSELIGRLKSAARASPPRLGKHHADPDSAAPCPDCGKPMRSLKSAKGLFWGCSGYPDCKVTLPDVDGRPGQRRATSAPAAGPVYPCPDCRKPMRQRASSRGPFWGCSGYPACHYTQPDEGGKPGVRPADVRGKTVRQDLPAPARQAAKPPSATAVAAATAVAGSPCPSCASGKLIGRVMKDSGRPFLGCTAFPACRHFQWLPHRR